MLSQTRPDIARALEETVTHLKELESRIQVFKTGLASLSQSIGHPQAAQMALSPPTNIGSFGMVSPFQQVPSFGFQSFGVNPNLPIQSPGIQQPFFTQQPFGQQPFGQQSFGIQQPFFAQQPFGVQQPFVSGAPTSPYPSVQNVPVRQTTPIPVGYQGVPAYW